MTPTQLRRRLARLGLTTAEVARRLPTSRSNFTRWLRGDQPIPPWLDRALSDLEREVGAAQQPPAT